MFSRQLTPLDRFITSVNRAMRTVAVPASRSSRRSPAEGIDEAQLDAGQQSHVAGLMRVNHAGEIAAQALYQGHAAVARDSKIEAHMQRAADEEYDHLAWCEQRIQELGHKPSRLSPLWYAGAYAIGAASGLLGDKWSLGFIAETERQVCVHLDSHLDRLPANDSKSRAIVEQMRAEEAVHGKSALDAGAVPLPSVVAQLMRTSAKLMTKTAYWV